MNGIFSVIHQKEVEKHKSCFSKLQRTLAKIRSLVSTQLLLNAKHKKYSLIDYFTT
jgi:hypothetical protein